MNRSLRNAIGFSAGFLLVVLAAKAMGAEVAPAETGETVEKDSTGVIVVTVDAKPKAFIFISRTGKVLAVSAEDCKKQEPCIAIVSKLNDEGHAMVLPLTGGSET